MRKYQGAQRKIGTYENPNLRIWNVIICPLVIVPTLVKGLGSSSGDIDSKFSIATLSASAEPNISVRKGILAQLSVS